MPREISIYAPDYLMENYQVGVVEISSQIFEYFDYVCITKTYRCDNDILVSGTGIDLIFPSK